MIQRIQGTEYLKRYDNMTAEERAQYESRVGDWLSVDGQELVKLGGTFEARLQNVLQVSAGWNDRQCQAFEDGAVLLSALVGQFDTWLPDMLYVKSAKRAIRLMFELLWNVDAGHTDFTDHTDKNAVGKPKEEVARGKAASKQEQGDARIDTAEREQTRPEVNGKATQPVGGKAADKGLAKDSVRMQAGAAKDNAYTVEAGGAASVSPDAKPTTVTSPVPARPRHIDQYVHLLPEKTQEHAAQVQGLLRELDETRRKMDLLMDDKTAKDSDREAWAKKATAIDNKLRKIYDELDGEWDKLVKQGRVVVDDLGNARVVEVKTTLNDQNTQTDPVGDELTSEQSRPEDKARRRELRKWLVDTRRGNGDTREEHVKKWQENFKEFLAFEGDAAFEDEKIRAAAEHYGIDLTQISQISQKEETTN